MALVDTGASTTCIDDALARQLGLPVIDVVQMTSASHAGTEANVCPIQMEIVGSPIRVNVPRAIGANLAPQGIVALIGRDYLQHCTLSTTASLARSRLQSEDFKAPHASSAFLFLHSPFTIHGSRFTAFSDL